MRQEYVNEIDSVISRVNSVRKTNSLIFPMFSDLHVDSVDSPEAVKLLDALSVICSELQPTAIIDLGDNLSMLGRKHHVSNLQVSRILIDLFDAMHKITNCPLFLVNGNHDAVGTDFFKPDLWNQIIRGKYDNTLARVDEHGSYYYVDYPDAKLRMVYLSIPHESDLAAANPTPLWSFGSEQLKWLKEVALDTPDSILLFSHVPFYYRYRGDKTRIYEVWDGEKTAQTYVDALCGWIDDAEEAANIIAQRGNVIACFSGHTHADSFWRPYERRGEDMNYLPCCQFVTTHAAHNSQAGALGVAIDILVWNPDERDVHLIRFGDGEDRKLDNNYESYKSGRS